MKVNEMCTMVKYQRTFALISAAVCWFAVITQAVLMIENRVASLSETVVRFFSFFTILTNVLVAITFTVNGLPGNTRLSSLLSRPGNQTAVAVYILVVALIYNAILRFIWSPTGMQQLVDELLHLVIPVLFLVYWIWFVLKLSFDFSKIFYWMIYPLVYLVWIISRGAVSGFYPYPFVDASKLGYHRVAINCGLILILFLFLSFLFLIVSRTVARPKQDHAIKNNKLPL